MKFYMDGDDRFPTICYTGTEDYFGGAWNFGDTTFSTRFSAIRCFTSRKPNSQACHLPLARAGSIRFKKNLKVTIQALGHWPNRKFSPDRRYLLGRLLVSGGAAQSLSALPPREARFPR